MLIVPVQSVPNQTISVLLGDQSCQITLFTRASGLYISLAVSNQSIIDNVICQNVNRVVRYPYLGFVGDLWFFDQQGSDDPFYTGLGSRFLLEYLEAADQVIA